MQHYVKKFVSDLWHVGVFIPGTLDSSINKTVTTTGESDIKHPNPITPPTSSYIKLSSLIAIYLMRALWLFIDYL